MASKTNVTRRKTVGVIDLTQGGLFPDWGGIGINRNKHRERKKAGVKKGQTPGRQKNIRCQATALERHCAKRSRGCKHKNYGRTLERWAKKSN